MGKGVVVNPQFIHKLRQSRTVYIHIHFLTFARYTELSFFPTKELKHNKHGDSFSPCSLLDCYALREAQASQHQNEKSFYKWKYSIKKVTIKGMENLPSNLNTTRWACVTDANQIGKERYWQVTEKCLGFIAVNWYQI